MRLQVSTEVEPAVFDAAVIPALGARIVHRVHIGWLSLDLEADRLEDLRTQRGVTGTLAVVACDDRLDQLPEATQWHPLAEGDCHALLAFRIEAGSADGRVVALRQSAEVQEKCFVRSHKTAAMDLTLSVPDPAAQDGQRVVVRHSDGLRDGSAAGMHDWKAGESHSIVMWVGHLPAGDYAVTGGVDGWVRVKTKLVPWTLPAKVRLGGSG